MSSWIKGLGYPKIEFKSDNERPLLAWKAEVAKSLREAGVGVSEKEFPVGDHAANGDAEAAVREV